MAIRGKRMTRTNKTIKLLRPFDLDAAKRGEPICYRLDGSKRIYMTGPDKANRLCVEDPADGRFVLAPVDKYCMAPLCWVEGKPVYKGDVLYLKHGTAFSVGGIDEEHNALHAKGSCIFLDLSKFTWTPSKVKREVKVLAYLTGENLVWKRCDAEVPDFYIRVPSEDKVIEIEEPAGSEGGA